MLIINIQEYDEKTSATFIAAYWRSESEPKSGRD